MVLYFVDPEPNGKRAIQYDDLNVYPLHTELSADPKYQLYVFFSLKGSVDIKSDASGYPVILKSGELALLNVGCELTFQIDSTAEQKTIRLTPAENARLHRSGRSAFTAPIDARDGEHLNAWRKGKTLLIKWKITGYVVAMDSQRYVPIIWIDASNSSDNTNMLPSLSPNAFESRILVPLKLSRAFIEEFPLDIPDRVIKTEQAATLPSGVAGIMQDVHRLVEHLNNAVEVLRNARTGYEYRHVMDEVKSALDAIRNYSNKQDLGRELLVDTSIIGNIDPQGGDNAAADIIDRFLEILDNTYWIASKPAHTKLSRVKGLA